MTTRKLISVVVAVGSVWLGGSVGAEALVKANAAPLAGASVPDPSAAAAPARLHRI